MHAITALVVGFLCPQQPHLHAPRSQRSCQMDVENDIPTLPLRMASLSDRRRTAVAPPGVATSRDAPTVHNGVERGVHSGKSHPTVSPAHAAQKPAVGGTDDRLFELGMLCLSLDYESENGSMSAVGKDKKTKSTDGTCAIVCVGVGGGGGNTVNRMVQQKTAEKASLEFIALNTDEQALDVSLADTTLTLGRDASRGLGAGGKPAVGAQCARETAEEIHSLVQHADMVFITAGMGGGTGSGAAPVVAEIAKQAGCLTVGVVTKPFAFEGKQRMTQALNAIEELERQVDVLIVVSNDRLLEIVPDNYPLEDAFLLADEILRQGIIGISDIIVKPGLINVDFADVCSVMGNAGQALLGIGRGTGKQRARDAAIAAVSSPLLDFPLEKVPTPAHSHATCPPRPCVHLPSSRFAYVHAFSGDRLCSLACASSRLRLLSPAPPLGHHPLLSMAGECGRLHGCWGERPLLAGSERGGRYHRLDRITRCEHHLWHLC